MTPVSASSDDDRGPTIAKTAEDATAVTYG
ncbi:hypothetical protein SUDANB176_00412 [Streptomyces sp. enrichment culture]